MLTQRTPGSGPPADLFSTQQSAVARTDSFRFPSLVNQPGRGRIGKIMANDPHGRSSHKPSRAIKLRALSRLKLSCTHSRNDLRTPQNLVGHPVPHAVKAALIQQHSFDWRTRVSLEKLRHELGRKLRGDDFRRSGRPPFGLAFSMMKTNPAEQAGITKNERASALSKHQMIVPGWSESSGFAAELSSHAEVDSDPVPA